MIGNLKKLIKTPVSVLYSKQVLQFLHKLKYSKLNLNYYYMIKLKTNSKS